MLNGIVTTFSTNDANAQTITFNNVPPGNHSLLVYTVQVPLEFFDIDFSVVTRDATGADVVQRRYIRPQNADEYTASPGYVLVSAQTPEARAVGNTLRFDDIQPGPDRSVQLRFYSPGRRQSPGAEPIRGPGVNALQLLLDAGVVQDQPFVTILRQGEDIVVSWSQKLLRDTLESTPSLTDLNWTAVAGVSNNRYTVTLRTGVRFFRLKK